MKTTILFALTLASSLHAQEPVVDRGLSTGKPVWQRIELAGQGFLGDSFPLGTAGEIWMIDAIRLWAAPTRAAASCSRNLGDALEKITLLGALENKPIPGQPECDCHALVAVATAALQKTISASANRDVEITSSNGLWQIDFRNVRWSLPGGQEVLFSLRATDRPKAACPVADAWSLAAVPANAGDRLRKFNAKGVPDGFAEGAPQPVRISVQVWAHKVD